MGDIDTNKLVKALLAGLSPQQRDVLAKRYGLNEGKALTLAAVGKKYRLTRERIRQIENSALIAIKPKFNEGDLRGFVGKAADYLKQFNGARNEAVLLKDWDCSANESSRVKFLLEASGKFKYYGGDNDYHAYWYLSEADNKRALEAISGLKNYLKNNRGKQYEPKSGAEINYISVSKAFDRNSFNDFGLVEWEEVRPQGARDWAHLILKKEKRPLHFTELAEIIGRFRKTKKKTNAQTIHNELIKDDRFVLVGRGTYGLREHGLLPGTAKEVIAHFLKKHGPLKPREVIELVLRERTFKEGTLLLGLQNRKHFQRLEDGRYTVKEV